MLDPVSTSPDQDTHFAAIRTACCALAAAVVLCAASAGAVDGAGSNRAPLADAGAPQTAVLGQRIALDASASVDADGDRLSYRWALVSTPRGSAAKLAKPDALRPQFSVDLLGDYVAELIVSDGKRDSAPQRVVVSTHNSAPVAVASPGGSVARGDAIVLTSADSYDADGDALSAHWSILEQPAGSRVALRQRGAGSGLLQANASGDYVLQLVVNDGQQDSAPIQVRYSTVESAPVAHAGDDRVSIIGARLRLDGGRSLDSDGEALGYRWSLLHTPASSAARLTAAETPRPVLNVDRPGLYVAQLIVSDGRRDSAADTVVIEARAPGGGALIPASALGGSLGNAGAVRGGSDVDGDGVPDLIDNCVETFNPDQRDTNGDGFGNICDPDLDNDGFITNSIDLGLLKAAFFTTPGDANWNEDADFNGDGAVNTIELGIIKSFFFGPPGPIAINFINPAGGSWHDPNNWNLGIVPTTVHSVRIDLGPGVVVTFSTGSTEIASMRTSSDFELTGGTLSVVGNMQVNAPFTVSGGTLAKASIVAPLTGDDIIIDGNATFDRVTLGEDLTINNQRTLTAQNGLTLDGSTVTIASSGSGTRLSLAGSNGLLDGNGEVVFGGITTSNTTNELYRGGTGNPLIVGSGITVRSGTAGGRINSASFGQPMVIEGTVVSDLTNRTVSLNGTDITIASGANISIAGGDFDLIGAWTNEGTITGSGGSFDTASNNNSAWDNNGVISLTATPTELSGLFTPADIGNFTSNDDVVLNGRLELEGQNFDISTLPGNTIFNGGTFFDGTLITTPLTLSVGNFTLDTITLAVDATVGNARTLTALNGLTLNGSTITLASSGNTTRLSLAGSNGLLDGSGELVFGGTTTSNTANELYRGGSGGALTVGAGITVRSGTSGGRINSASFGQPMVIEGTVVSDLPGRTVSLTGTPITLAASASVNINGGDFDLIGAWTNEGTITATGGSFDTGSNNNSAWDNNGTITLIDTPAELSGVLVAANIGNFTSNGDVVLNGRLELEGQSFDIGTLPGNLILNGGTIFDGTLITTPLVLSIGNFTLDTITLAVDATVGNARTLTTQNGLTLSASTVTLASSGNTTRLSLAGSNGVLDGNGEVVFGGTTTSNTANELYRGGSGGALTVSPGITVRSGASGGRINSASFGQPMLIEGTIVSDLPGRTVSLTGTPITLAASATVNIDGGDFDLMGAWTNEGAITGNGGNIDTGSNNNSAWDNNGTITLTGTASELSGTFTPADIGSFTSNADVVLNGRLELGGQNFDISTLPGITILSGGTFFDGTLITTPLVLSIGNFTLDTITLAVDATVGNARTLTTQNGLTLSASTVTLASSGNTTRLSLAGSNGVLDGNGEVVFGGTTTSNTANELYRGGSGGALTVSPGITVRSGASGGRINSASFSQPMLIEGTVVSDLTNRTVSLSGAGITIASGANISIAGGDFDLIGAWTNEGTITGNGGNFDTGSNNNSAWDNNGTITLTGTAAELSGTFAPADIGSFTSNADVVLNGRLELGGQNFDISTLPGNTLFSGSTFFDGTLIGTPLVLSDGNLTLDTITLAVDLTIGNARALTAQNGLTLSSSTVTLTSSGNTTRLSLAGSNGLLDGNGEVVFGGTTTSNTANELYRGGSGSALTVGAGITVRSGTAGGRINSASFGQPLVIEGTLVSDLVSRSVSLFGTSITVNGDMQAGAGADIAFSNAFTVGSGATLSVDIGGTASTDFGTYSAPASAATLGGTLDVNLVNSFTPTLGDTFEVLTFASRTGTFASETGTAIGGGLALQVNYNASDVTLETVTAP